jgi:hypothetical protein
MTILIGQQASGKSVLCKLIYFLFNVIQDQARFVTELESLENFKKEVKEGFTRWFPTGSWGPAKFEVSLVAGDYEIKLTRTEYKGNLGERFRLHFSDAFSKHYERALDIARKYSNRKGTEQLELRGFQIFDQMESLNRRLLKEDFFDNQVFIPAARSFFTSMGRAVSAFEQGGTLDPLTIIFGRRYVARMDRRFPAPKLKSPQLTRSISELLGGEIVRKNDQNFVVSRDGRRVPFAALSSGQQEVLPLLTTIPYLASASRQLIYIEEPEAHLFPSAQGKLVEILATILNMNSARSCFLITTHSPYVLAKFNNLVKAGALAQTAKNAVARVVTEEAWLHADALSAYAIQDANLVNIVDAEGLIGADYLDEVSTLIAQEFDALLDIEVPNAI